MNITLKVNGLHVHYIDTPEGLQSAVKELKKQERIALDLEFDRNRYRYGFNLCLIQVATEKECYLIDPLEVSELQSLWDVLEDANIQKVVHGASEDMRLLYKHNCKPKNIFDTELAGKLLDYQRLSLRNLLSDNLGVEMDKGQQTSNWFIRPLTMEQIHYCASDVVYMLALREKIVESLEEKGMRTWHEEDCKVFEEADYSEDDLALLKKSDYKAFSERQLFVLEQLLELREEWAEQVNRPPAQVINNGLIRELLNTPSILDNWEKAKGVHRKFKSQVVGKKLKTLIEKASAEALDLGLSNGRARPNYSYEEQQQRIEASKKKEELRHQIFVPIQARIKAMYGESAGTFIFNKGAMMDLLDGTITLANMPRRYCANLIQQVANEISIDLSAYKG